MKYDTKRLFFVLISVTLLALPLIELIQNMFGRYIQFQFWFLYSVGIVGSAVAIVNIIREKKIGVVEILYGLLVVTVLISQIFKVDEKGMATYFYWRELVPHFLAYYSLFYMASKLKTRESEGVDYNENILKIIIIAAILNVVAGMLQILELYPVDCIGDTGRHVEHNMVFGFTRHSNQYAFLSVIFNGSILGFLLFFAKELKTKLALFILLSLSILCSFHTFARIAWVGNLAIVLVYAIYLVISRKKVNVKYYLLCLGVFVAVSIAVLIVLEYRTGEISQDAVQTVTTDLSSPMNFASFRGEIWAKGLKTVPSNWWHGLGPDNYKMALYEDFINGEEMVIIGHNEFIQLLVTQGVFAFLTFVSALVIVFVKGFKNIAKTFPVFFMVTAAYIAASIFINGTMSVSPYFWVVLGMCYASVEFKEIHK